MDTASEKSILELITELGERIGEINGRLNRIEGDVSTLLSKVSHLEGYINGMKQGGGSYKYPSPISKNSNDEIQSVVPTKVVLAMLAIFGGLVTLIQVGFQYFGK